MPDPMIRIGEEDCASDIVKRYYRTAMVFKKYDIPYCCGGKWPLRLVFETKGLDTETVLSEIRQAALMIPVPAALPFSTWKIDFLTEYIINVHHSYLRESLPFIKTQLEHFVVEHRKKYPYVVELQEVFENLHRTLFPHLSMEEEIIFPYIRQIAHAYESRESYASLLVRTLRKPVEDLMHHEHQFTVKALDRFRSLTRAYQPPEAACTSHHLLLALLHELDNNLVQHLHLENDILFPRAVAMEKELLANKP